MPTALWEQTDAHCAAGAEAVANAAVRKLDSWDIHAWGLSNLGTAAQQSASKTSDRQGQTDGQCSCRKRGNRQGQRKSKFEQFLVLQKLKAVANAAVRELDSSEALENRLDSSSPCCSSPLSNKISTKMKHMQQSMRQGCFPDAAGAEGSGKCCCAETGQLGHHHQNTCTGHAQV